MNALKTVAWFAAIGCVIANLPNEVFLAFYHFLTFGLVLGVLYAFFTDKGH